MTPGIYVGISEPWDGTLAGFFRPKTDAEVVRSAVLHRIMTATDERVMIEFGTEFPRSSGEPNDLELQESLIGQIGDALRSDPRVEGVTISPLSEENTLVLQITYQLAGDPFRRQVDLLRVKPALVSTSSTSR